MGLQLIEGIVPVFGDKLQVVDGQWLVGIHRDQHVPNVGLQLEEMMDEPGWVWERPGDSLATHPQPGTPWALT